MALLGPLELRVLEEVWQRGECAVRDVVLVLEQPLAYTTVMTTLDRLFKKGLLNRRQKDRAFVYTARFTRAELEQRRTREFISGFLTRPERSGELLISCLVEAVGEHDEALLDELEQKIRMRREELARSKA